MSQENYKVGDQDWILSVAIALTIKW